MQLTITPFFAQDIQPYIPAVAKLRIEIFRYFPYLYDGNMAYEEKYLHTYAQAPECVFVLVFNDKEIVGASTALPLCYETIEVQQPFIDAHYKIDEVFYFGESILQPAYRGQGIGRQFFVERENYAKKLGHFRYTSFCAVERSIDHPRRPIDYVPLDEFWHHRGYQKHPELQTQFSWKEIDETEESSKKMVFWLKELD